MHHRFLRPDVEAQRLLLQIGVGVRHPLVLPQVLRPGLHQEPLHDAFRIAGVLGDAPGVSAVAATRPLQHQ